MTFIPRVDASYRLGKLAALLHRVGLGLDLSSFDDRLQRQKLVVLAQVLGFPLGYPFSWYVRGPYSSSLATDLFQMNRGRIKDAALDAREQELADALAIRLAQVPRSNRTKELELLGSVAFRLHLGEKPDAVVKAMARLKPQFNEDDVRRAIQAYLALKIPHG